MILGNHDKYSDVKIHYKKDTNHNELFYETAVDNYKYIFLDTSKEELSNTQILWLQKQLKTEKQIVIFIHHPIIKIETPVDQLHPLKNGENVKSILIQSKKSITYFVGITT